MVIVTSTEFKSNIGHYLSLVSEEDIVITRNGKRVARLIEEKEDLLTIAKSLVGILPETITLQDAREEKQKRYEDLD